MKFLAFYFGHQVFNVLGSIFRTDQNGICCFDNDHIMNSGRGHELTGVTVNKIS